MNLDFTFQISILSNVSLVSSYCRTIKMKIIIDWKLIVLWWPNNQISLIILLMKIIHWPNFNWNVYMCEKERVECVFVWVLKMCKCKYICMWKCVKMVFICVCVCEREREREREREQWHVKNSLLVFFQ